MLSGKTAVVFDACFGFYSEEYFREMLVMERKRSERSRKPFLLALIAFMNGQEIPREYRSPKKIQQFIRGASREIDIKGWYHRHHAIGIIYTEYSQQAKETIVNKIRASMETSFGAAMARDLVVTCSPFPEEKMPVEQKESVADPRFYPSPQKLLKPNKVSLMLKRCIDIVGSLVGIVVFSPLLIAVSLAIKCTSKGPVFFTQKRVGQGGRLFTFIKFRSMRVQKDCSVHKEFVKKFIQNKECSQESGQPGVYKLKNDPRITPIGKFLRKSSIDELPQLFNVLKGDMSLVGPRPAIPYEIDEYDTWHKRRVCEVRPGITGYWQVKGRSKTSFETMVRMDIQYTLHWSLLWDIIIILQTPFAILKGAY